MHNSWRQSETQLNHCNDISQVALSLWFSGFGTACRGLSDALKSHCVCVSVSSALLSADWANRCGRFSACRTRGNFPTSVPNLCDPTRCNSVKASAMPRPSLTVTVSRLFLIKSCVRLRELQLSFITVLRFTSSAASAFNSELTKDYIVLFLPLMKCLEHCLGHPGVNKVWWPSWDTHGTLTFTLQMDSNGISCTLIDNKCNVHLNSL